MNTVLKKEYQLEMPSNYVDIEMDEMEYVDGGGWYQSGVYYGVKYGINMAVNSLLGGGSIKAVKSVLAKLGTKQLKSAIVSALKKWVGARVANSLGGTIVSGISGFLSFSIGGAVAEILDRKDGSNDNQIYFSRLF